jgi:hypothetical protein
MSDRSCDADFPFLSRREVIVTIGHCTASGSPDIYAFLGTNRQNTHRRYGRYSARSTPANI